MRNFDVMEDLISHESILSVSQSLYIKY